MLLYLSFGMSYRVVVIALPPTFGYLQWLAFENVFVHRDQT
jgi:hypothetical protein